MGAPEGPGCHAGGVDFDPEIGDNWSNYDSRMNLGFGEGSADRRSTEAHGLVQKKIGFENFPCRSTEERPLRSGS